MKEVRLSGSIVDIDTQYTQKYYEYLKAFFCMKGQLVAWKNEQVNAQIALVTYETFLSDVSIEVSDLRDDQGNQINKENVTATFVRSTNAYNGPFLGYGDPTREVPEATKENRSESADILYQTTPINLLPHKVQAVWIQVKIPKESVEGNYSFTLEITAKEVAEPLIFFYHIEVLDLVLPEVDSFRKTFDIEMWQYPYSSAEYYGVEPFSDKHFSILKPIMENYQRIGGDMITVSIIEEPWAGQTYSQSEIHYPSMVKWEKQLDGSFYYDFTDFDRWIQFNRDIGIANKIVLYSLAPWHKSFTYWESNVLVREPFMPGSDRYREVWQGFLQQLVEHLMAKGWFEDTYIGIDERGISLDIFNLIDSIKNIHMQSLKIAAAMDDFIDQWELAIRVDDLSIGDNAVAEHPEEFEKLLEIRNAKGLKTSLYSCTEHQPGNFSLSAPVESYWSVINAGKETAGFLRWAYDAWVEDPLNDVTHNAFEAGDVFFIYPDSKDAERPIVHSSIRLERMAEGVRDVNKIKWLLQQAPRLQEKVTAMYNRLHVPVRLSRTYLSDSAVKDLSNQMNFFKQELNELSRIYLQLVKKSSNKVEAIKINTIQKSVSVMDKLTLTVSVYPPNVLNPEVIWATSDNQLAQIDNQGRLTAKKSGVVKITATSILDINQSDTLIIVISSSESRGQENFCSFEKEETIFVGETYSIIDNCVEKNFQFLSTNPEIASVNEHGVITGKNQGITLVKIKDLSTGTETPKKFIIKKKLIIKNELPVYQLPEKYLSDVEKSPGTDRQYLGQPDLIRTRTGRMISIYPKGHGKGPLIMQISDDDGKSWHEKIDLPVSWKGSQETPTLYVLDLDNHVQRLLLITSCPGWGLDSAGNRYGWNTSYSDDDGESWSEYRHWFSKRQSDNNDNDAIVAMASLIQLRDENHRPLQKWLGVYHSRNYVNYKSYLTFGPNGEEQWSEPQAYLSEFRSIEEEYQICEIGLFRSADGSKIVGIARSQSHNNPATLIYSQNEGITWSEPMDLPGALAGERHKIVYDPINQKLVVSFREIFYDLNENNQFDGCNDWVAGDWGVWVGTYEDLMNQEAGDYRILIAEDWSNNAKSGDTGYSGVVILEDGTLVMHSYGHWDKKFSSKWKEGITTDLSYIKQAKFKLKDIEAIR